MKTKCMVLIAGILCSFVSCQNDGFDINKPDVGEFVHLLKNDEYKAKSASGYDLPDFTVEQIVELRSYTDDYSEIQVYPGNPISSKRTDPKILGECLLWTIEGIKLGTKYASLEPHLIDTSTFTRLTAQELQTVSRIYKDWWDEYKQNPTELLREKNLLGNTSYKWN